MEKRIGESEYATKQTINGKVNRVEMNSFTQIMVEEYITFCMEKKEGDSCG